MSDGIHIDVAVLGTSLVADRMDAHFVGFMEGLTGVLDRGAGRCVSEAKAHAPVGTPASTHKKGYVGGLMRNSIRKEPIKRTLTTITASATTNVNYSKYVEFGTYKMRAQPFFGPAFLVGHDQILAELATLV